MKIAYIDLNTNFSELYRSNPDRYGGGRIVGAAFLENTNYFHIYANEGSFKGVREDKLNQCHVLSQESIAKIRAGDNLENHIPELDNYDLLFSHACGLYLNTYKERKKLTWSIGWRETCSPLYKDICLFSEYQYPQGYDSNTKFHKVIIGPKIQDFQEYEKEDFIFQCSRHGDIYNSIKIATICNMIPCNLVLAGPIESNCDLLRLTGKNIIYLGEITEEEKIKNYKKAKLVTQVQNHLGLITLTAKEALAYGCGIICNNYNEWNNLVDRKNSLFVNSVHSFYKAWKDRDCIKQKDCWDFANLHSEEKMLETFNAAFEKILNEK